MYVSFLPLSYIQNRDIGWTFKADVEGKGHHCFRIFFLKRFLITFIFQFTCIGVRLYEDVGSLRTEVTDTHEAMWVLGIEL